MYPQSIIWIKYKNNRYTPVHPNFTIYKTIIKVGYNGVYIAQICYCDELVFRKIAKKFNESLILQLPYSF